MDLDNVHFDAGVDVQDGLPAATPHKREGSTGSVLHVQFAPYYLPGNGCRNCGFIAWSLPVNLVLPELKLFNNQIEHRRPIERGQYLHHAGSVLRSLYVVNSGVLKTSIEVGDRREQVTGFSIARDMIGLDAIDGGRHRGDTVALEDASVCGIPCNVFEKLTHDVPALERHFRNVMIAERARQDHGIMLLLSAMPAQERVAAFLLRFSMRYTAIGRSATQFSLPMSRKDIGSYLGLRLETVCRAFNQLNELELIATTGKDVEIRNPVLLQRMIWDYKTRRALP